LAGSGPCNSEAVHSGDNRQRQVNTGRHSAGRHHFAINHNPAPVHYLD
jgi:hypothetical protein